MAAAYWWQDLLDRNKTWQGLELIVRKSEGAGQTMEMLSGHHGRMALQVRGDNLFWASMLKDHSGVWLVMNVEHPGQQALLPPVTSHDVEPVRNKRQAQWTGEWCRYFARRLLDVSTPLLAPGRWLLRPMFSSQAQGTPLASWRFDAPASSMDMGCDWCLYGEDFPDLAEPVKVRLVDWWWGGNLLLGRYPVQAEAGRLKWWRKKCREGTLPPILVWYIAGLASFVVLDGHYRLQAAIEEGIPPQFLVLSELKEQTLAPDPEHRARVAGALEQQLRKNPKFSIDSVNQSLINLYDTRYLYAATHSRAVLGNGERWEQEVSAYLLRHQLGDGLDNILNRVNDDVLSAE